MSLSLKLEGRSDMKCELCGSADQIDAVAVAPRSADNDDDCVVVCNICAEQIQNSDNINSNHLRCLTESIWSEVPAVQAISYRLLNRMPDEGWAQDTLAMVYLDEETIEWAQADDLVKKLIHKDSNGNILEAGDNVTLIQDLNVKGANFTAKRGTAVRRIRLVHDNAEHIEGKIDGQHIVILTKFVKKS